MNSQDIPTLIDVFRQGTEHLTKMAKAMETPFDMRPQDPRRVHNMYVKNLVTCYASKGSELSQGVLDAIDRSNYLIYAVCGRSLLETTATLRYYITEKYRPLLDRGPLSGFRHRKARRH